MNTIKELINNNTDKYYNYYSLLTEWNEKMNLTAITDEYSVATKHFLDCMAVFDHVDFKEGASVIDVGCGAGFPSAVMAIERPDLRITLLDSLNKRLNFLNCVIEELPLPNCTTLHARAEEFANKNGYKFTEISSESPLEKSQKLADYADCLIAFWDCTSKGTAVIISTFTKVSKHVKIVCINK